MRPVLFRGHKREGEILTPLDFEPLGAQSEPLCRCFDRTDSGVSTAATIPEEGNSSQAGHDLLEEFEGLCPELGVLKS